MKININDYNYPLPDERIAKFPLDERDSSKLLVYRKGTISERKFRDLGEELGEGKLLVFNNTKVVRARLVMHKPSGARVEVFCLEPHAPADYVCSAEPVYGYVQPNLRLLDVGKLDSLDAAEIFVKE